MVSKLHGFNGALIPSITGERVESAISYFQVEEWVYTFWSVGRYACMMVGDKSMVVAKKEHGMVPNFYFFTDTALLAAIF